MISPRNKQWNDVTQPTLVVRPDIAKVNIARMAEKAKQSGVRFRPHFKTHQSTQIAQWFKDAGVTAITVSSVTMAQEFAKAGWQDITIAFPVNVRELEAMNILAQQITLHVLVENLATIQLLAKVLEHPVTIWIETDTGYKRSGVLWDNKIKFLTLARAIKQHDRLTFAGLLTHAGHSYKERSREGILQIYEETRSRVQRAKESLAQEGFSVQLSLGDTPCCSLATEFTGLDEIRPGNFVFYDLQQFTIGSCTEEQLALAVACPVVGLYPERGELILYGGAVHLSKDFAEVDGIKKFGAIALARDKRWSMTPAYLASVSQEHGIVKAPKTILEQVQVGDLLFVIPAHVCLAVNALKNYRTLDGQWVS